MTEDARFWFSLKLTVIYTIITVFLQVVIGLALAMAFFRGFKGQGIMRVSVLLPMILAPVVVGLTWRTLILTPEYGILDYLSILLGFGSKPWLVNPTWALISVIIIHTWQWTPFAFLIFLASLNAMPEEPLEAALLDTCSSWQRFRYVILPMLRPAIIIVLIFRTMIALRAFAAIFSATGGGPGTATEILELIRLPGVLQFTESWIRGSPWYGFVADHHWNISCFFQDASHLMISIEENLNHG